MPSEQSTKLAEAVQRLREIGGEEALLVADLTDALANALVERDVLRQQVKDGEMYQWATLRYQCDLSRLEAGELRANRDALQKRLDAVIEESNNFPPGSLGDRINRLARGKE